MGTVLAPATALLARMTYAWKILLISLVLLLPLGIVTNGFVNDQSVQINFSALERDGVRYLRPLLEVAVRAVDARDRAVHGSGPSAAQVGDAASRVDAVDQSIGGPLGVSDGWKQVRSALASAASASGPDNALTAWNTAVDGINTLIAKVSDNSNLTLDPDIDSYYVMDALVGRLVAILDATFRGADTAFVAAGGAAVKDRAALVGLAITNSEAVPNIAAFHDGMAKAIAATANPTLLGQADAVKQLTERANAIGDAALKAAADGTPLTLDRSVTADLAGRVTQLVHVLVPVLDDLLVARIAKLRGGEYTDLGYGLVALVLAAYLLLAFWRGTTRSLRGMVVGLEGVSGGDLTVRASVDSRDEVGRMAGALNHALDRVREVIQGLAGSAGAVSQCAGELNEVNNGLREAARETAAKAVTLRGSASAVSADVSTVAAGTDEMSAAIREIATGSSEAARVAAEAVAAATATHETVIRLGRSSEEIGGVVRVITTIAGQTNLLALNATIEAARAGESGKGFAVVANEVKELAQETAKATDDIIQRVEALQADTSAAVTAIDQIASVIGRINDIQATIASAVEEQTATTAEMGRNLSGVADSSNNIAREAESLTGDTERATAAAGATEQAAASLAATAQELRGYVGRFRL
jgi:methyl-accepting chemotaxis protein